MAEPAEPDGASHLETLGIRIRYAREAIMLSQDELAKAIGGTQGTVSAWETGARNPHPSNLISVARATGCDLEWLKTGEGAPPVRYTDREKADEAWAQSHVDRVYGSPYGAGATPRRSVISEAMEVGPPNTWGSQLSDAELVEMVAHDRRGFHRYLTLNEFAAPNLPAELKLRRIAYIEDMARKAGVEGAVGFFDAFRALVRSRAI